MKKAVPFIVFVLVAAMFGFSQQPTEDEKERLAIKQAALDYIEGWYEANPERMERALHPDLVKSYVVKLPTGKDILQSVSALSMIEFTRAGGGSKTPKDLQKNEVTILDVSGNMAAVKCVSADYVDYLHLAKTNGQWKIVNALWESRKKK